MKPNPNQAWSDLSSEVAMTESFLEALEIQIVKSGIEHSEWLVSSFKRKRGELNRARYAAAEVCFGASHGTIPLRETL